MIAPRDNCVIFASIGVAIFASIGVANFYKPSKRIV
jgi:hypothetical protein